MPNIKVRDGVYVNAAHGTLVTCRIEFDNDETGKPDTMILWEIDVPSEPDSEEEKTSEDKPA